MQRLEKHKYNNRKWFKHAPGQAASVEGEKVNVLGWTPFIGTGEGRWCRENGRRTEWKMNPKWEIH